MYDTQAFYSAIRDSGMKLIEVAEKAGMSRSHLTYIMKGQRGFSFFTYLAICKAIEREPSEFLTPRGKELLKNELKGE